MCLVCVCMTARWTEARREAFIAPCLVAGEVSCCHLALLPPFLSVSVVLLSVSSAGARYSSQQTDVSIPISLSAR